MRNENEPGIVNLHGQGIGTVTRGMVHQRAGEIAFINGRTEDNVLQSDWQQALRELTGRDEPRDPEGEWDIESAQWDPAPGSAGHKVHTEPAHDEQTDSERIVGQGVAEAEHDLMFEHTREQIQQSES